MPIPSWKLPAPGIATRADRVVQRALKLVVEPIFEADFLAVLVGVSAQQTRAGRGRRGPAHDHTRLPVGLTHAWSLAQPWVIQWALSSIRTIGASRRTTVNLTASFSAVGAGTPGTVVATRAQPAWRAPVEHRRCRMSVSHRRENRRHGLMGGSRERNATASPRQSST